MKLLVLCTFVAVAGMVVDALPVQLLQYESSNDGLGTYRFTYEQDDGSSRTEEGELKNAGVEDEHIAVKGSYSWIGPDDVVYTVTYIADDNGYQSSITKERQLSYGISGEVASLLG